MKKPNLVFMYGDDSFSLSQELERWKFAFIEKHGDTNLEILDGKTSVNAIAASISAMPFLSEKRLVVLKDFLSENNADDLKKLIPVLENLSDSTVLVIAETSSPDKRSALFKELTKVATNRLFAKPKGAQLNTWIIRRSQAHGSQMDQRAAAYLSNLAGDNLWRLENEVLKLALYAGKNQITINMIDELISGSIEQSIFTMTDQLARKDSAGALKTMRMLQAQGQEAAFLFSMIARQFRLMLEMKSLSDKNTPPNAIASKMAVHPFVVQNTLKQCRNFTYPQLKNALKQLLIIDRRLKTGDLHLRQREEEQYLLAIEQVLLH